MNDFKPSSAAATATRPWLLGGAMVVCAAAVFVFALTRGIALPVAVAGAITCAILLLTVAGILRVAWYLMADESLGGSDWRQHTSLSALRQEKARVLRALKELEFDHELRKISVADFAIIRDQYRVRAVQLSRQIDGAAGLHPRTQALLQQRQSPASAATSAPDSSNEPVS